MESINSVVTTTTIHTDFLGSPVAETSATGAVTRVERYTPYGEPSDLQLDVGPGFTGHATDVATGLTYMQQRYMDQEIGRFLTPDPVGPEEDFIKHFNRYNYAMNNPVANIDPDGRYSCGSSSRIVCGKIDRYVKKINDALKNLKPGSDAYNKVARIVGYLGKSGGAGPVIMDKRLDPGLGGEANKNTMIVTIDIKQNENIDKTGKNTDTSGGASIAHEARHNIDTIANKSLPSTVDQARGVEINAYRTEKAVLNGNGLTSQLDTKAGFDAAVDFSVNHWIKQNDPY